jgi:hypothetical protein
MGSKIIRRPDFAGGDITDEEREKMAAHSALWIERAFRTEPADPRLIEEAIIGIYRAAKLAEPRVVLVPSPFVMAMAGGIAATWRYLFENNPLSEQEQRVSFDAMIDSVTNHATNHATYYATRTGTADATFNARRDRIYQATGAVITDVIGDAVYGVTKDATNNATRIAKKLVFPVAPDLAIQEATINAIYAVTGATRNTIRDTTQSWLELADSFVGPEWGKAALASADRWEHVYQSGNMEASDECFLTAARDIFGIQFTNHAGYAAWERAAINGGFRWMHPKFCLVSDFPEVLRVNARNQPHAEFGPSRRWRDGWSLWHLNGVRVEQWMAESHPDEIDAREVLQILNVDQRRELIRRMKVERFIYQLGPRLRVLDKESREIGGEYCLLAVDMNHGEPWRFLQMVNQSTGEFHIEAVPRECETVRHALNWRASQNINEEWFPTILS